MLLEFCQEMELRVSNTWSKRQEKRKVTFSMGEDETGIDLVFIKKEHRGLVQNVNPWGVSTCISDSGYR